MLALEHEWKRMPFLQEKRCILSHQATLTICNNYQYINNEL